MEKTYALIDENNKIYFIRNVDEFLIALDEESYEMLYSMLVYKFLYHKKLGEDIKSGTILFDYNIDDYDDVPFEEMNNSIELLTEKISKTRKLELDREVANLLMISDTFSRISLN